MDQPNTLSHDESKRVIRVGSDPNNDIVVEGLTVYPCHAEFTFVKNGWVIEDLTRSGNEGAQTFLERSDNPSERIPLTEPHWASSADTVYLGTYPFPLAQLLITPNPPEPDEPQPAQVVRVGSDSSNRIVIDAVTVSPRHAEFTLFADYCLIRDCESQMGTFLVDPEDSARTIPIVAGELKAGYDDVVLLGTYQFPLARLLEIKDILLHPGRPTCIGRAPNTDRNLDDIRVSNYHAQFVKKGTELFIEDLGRTSGTFVNDHRLPPKTPKPVKTTDTIRIGSYELSIDPQSPARVRVEFAGDIKLDVVNLRYAVGKKEIFRNISFSVKPGELVGIMGRSGHGKSVLLESLIGKAHIPTGGKAFINKKTLPEYWEHFRRRIGYVPQSEMLPPPLTVKALLEDAARLWLPVDLSEREIEEQVTAVLAQLNLHHLKERRIGLLSGGEYRRVNIGYELIRAPDLLFLDEPTTGLSVAGAQGVMEVIRQLANTGRTVLTIIHQPSRKVFDMLDLVAILFRGRLLYFGPRQFTIDYFKPDARHPEEIFSVLAEYDAQIDAEPERTQELLEKWETKFRESDIYDQYVAERLNGLQYDRD